MKNIICFLVAVFLPSCLGIPALFNQGPTPPPSCNKNLTASSGVVTSPGYPAQYPNDTDCNTKITVPIGKVIQLTFNEFDVEEEDDCSYDYLMIVDGSDRKRLCGYSASTYISKSNVLNLVFQSDSSVNGNGFKVSFMAIVAPLPTTTATPTTTAVPSCGPDLTASSGVVTSPGYPAKYPNNMDCNTKITVPFGKVIQLTFNTFDVEDESDCLYDYLMIDDGSSNKKRLCGSSASKYISKSNVLSLVFHSDSSMNGNGFKVSFMAIIAPTVAPTIPPVPPKVNEAFCGQVKVQQSRVIGGSNATKGAWPWQIGLFSKYGQFFCGGSIINPQWAVTASHCMAGERPSDVFIKVGDWDLNSNDGTEQRVDVEKIIMHARYNLNGKLNYDIALLKLKRPVLLNDYVNTVCIPEKTAPVAVGTDCYITGWGKIKHPGNSHPILQQAILPVVDTQVCQTKLDKMNWGLNITDVMVCGGEEGSIKSGCHGDSGGPFVCKDRATNKFFLHGAVSWGSGRCSTSDAFSVFARVQALRQWIDDKMKSN